MELIGIGWMKVSIKPPVEPKASSRLIVPAHFIHDKVDIRKIFSQFTNQFPPRLRWITFHKDGSMSAEVLMSAELLQLSSPTLTIKELKKNEPIPKEIEPNMKKYRIEATFVGIRDASKLSHFSAGRYKIILSIGELMMSSGFSGKAFKRNLSFIDPHASAYLMLPEDFEFWPPIIIKHLDCSHKKPTVLGAAMIRRPDKFFVEDKPKEIQRFLPETETFFEAEEQTKIDMMEIGETEPLLANRNNFKLIRLLSNYTFPKFLQFSSDDHGPAQKSLENEFTWWTKFYNSNREEELINDCFQQLKVILFAMCKLTFKLIIFFFRFFTTSSRSKLFLSVSMTGLSQLN